MSKHTPGPWEVDGWNIFSGNLYIAEASVYDVGPVQTAANARLMAAGPDMYEALAALLDRYVTVAESGDCGFWTADDEPQVIAARAALAKARGE